LCFLASLGPFFYLLWAALTGNLSANPLSDLTNETGVWTLRFICLTLAITPLRKVTGWNTLVKFRRMAGLYAFFYGTLHLLTYAIADRFAGLDQAVGWVDAIGAWACCPGWSLLASTARGLAKSIGEDIYKRPFITIGFAAWLTMLPLAITSTAGWIRRLGGRRWNRLHRLVYLTGILGPLHYWWLVKADVSQPAGVCRGRRHAARHARLLESSATGGDGSCSAHYRDPDVDDRRRRHGARAVRRAGKPGSRRIFLSSAFAPSRRALLADTLHALRDVPDVVIFSRRTKAARELALVCDARIAARASGRRRSWPAEC